MTAGLIVNPLSGRRSGRGLVLAKRLADVPNLHIAVLGGMAELPTILAKFAAADVDTLFISSGDGTVHAIQTELAERSPFAKLPRLALLAHGTTNMTAADLGLAHGGIERQASFIAAAAAGAPGASIKRRATVRVANAADGRIRHGMFVGAGALWRATKFCQERVHELGLRGDWATAVTLVTGLARALMGGSAADDDRLDRPYPMRIETCGRVVVDGLQVLCLVTTLDRLILATRPFWGGAAAPLRATAIAHPPPSIVRWALPVLYGGEERRLPQQCQSFAADAMAIATPSPFVMDGEFFDAPTDEPLRIETGPHFTYVCG